jgi:hypothetical protein
MEQSASVEIQATANDLIINVNENSERQMEHQDRVLANGSELHSLLLASVLALLGGLSESYHIWRICSIICPNRSDKSSSHAFFFSFICFLVLADFD